MGPLFLVFIILVFIGIPAVMTIFAAKLGDNMYKRQYRHRRRLEDEVDRDGL